MSSVVSTQGMFRNCGYLRSIGSPSWNTPYLTNTSQMFENCIWFNDHIGLDMHNVINASSMFSNAQNFNKQIGLWSMNNCQNFSYMFNKARSFNSYLGSWQTNSANNVLGMFDGASSFNQDISGWNLTKCDNLTFMDDDYGYFYTTINSGYNRTFNGPPLSASNYSALLNRLDQTKTQFPTSNISLTVSKGRPDASGQQAKLRLVAYGWTIIDAEGTAT